MKKLALTLAILLAFVLGGVAQQLSFDFEDGTLQGWTVLDGDGDGHCWEPSIGGMGHNSNGMVMAYSTDYATGEPLTPNEYLVSPRLVLNEWPVINFFVCALDEIYCAEHFGVSISTTVNDDPLAFTLLHDWTLTAKNAGNRQGNWYEFTVDLSAYTGQEVYVAIRHHYCSGQSAICVDDIEIDGTIQQDGLVISPDILTFEEPWVPQTFTISNQTDNVVTISSINVEPDDNVVLLSGPGLPRTLQPNETMNVEVYVNGIGYKGYLTYYVNVATSIGYRQVTVRVNEEAWDEGLLWMPMQGLTFDENSPLTQGFNLTNTNALDSITIYELYEDGTDYLELVPSHSLPYVIPPHESLYIDVTLINFPENNTNVNIYSSSSLGQGSSPYVHIVGGLTPYYPLVHEGNDRQKWNVVYIGVTPNYPNDYHTVIQSIRDDINLDGVDYKLVWKEDVYDSKRIAGAVREEDKRVYFRRKIEQNYQEEVLLYDFNLTVGDTVTVNWMGQQLMVLEESEVEVDGTMRRQLSLGRYSVGYPPTEVDEYWIEGVGSTFGFLNSGSEGMGGAFIYLLCYHENGNLVWDNEAFDDCVMNSDGTLASFAPQGAEWYFDVFNPWGTHPEYERFFVEGDTIIQGHQCSIIDQRFVDTGHDGGEYVYEEDNKVYWFNPTTNAFSILYDFDAEAGESWYYEVGECSHQVIVDSVGSVTWNGHTYRTQWVRFNEDVQYYSGKIIEGIGYEKGLFPSIYVCDGLEMFDAEEIEYLRCYVNDGEMLYHEGGYDCDQTTITPPSHPEWYYEILNENGTITYQYMYQAGDTIINDEPTHILVKINTLYDKGLREEVTHEYVFELNGKLYWWNKRLGLFTVLYDYEAEVGDSWTIMVGIEPPLTMHVDGVDYIEYEGRTYRVMRVSDPENLFSGNIVCGIGHLTSFFPERLMDNGDGIRVEGMRCYWVENELVFKPGDEDCDAIYSEVHGVDEDGPSTGSGTFAVYPNPTNGILTVHHSAFHIHHSEFQIANLMGQTVLSGNINAENQQIDVSSLPQGMYFITVGEATRKFVVE